MGRQQSPDTMEPLTTPSTLFHTDPTPHRGYPLPTIGAPSPSQFDLHPINGTSVSMYSYSCGSTVTLAASMTPSNQTSNGGYNETTTCVMSGPLAAGQYLVGWEFQLGRLCCSGRFQLESTSI